MVAGDAEKMDAAKIRRLSAYLGDSLSLGRALSTPIADPPQLTVPSCQPPAASCKLPSAVWSTDHHCCSLALLEPQCLLWPHVVLSLRIWDAAGL